MINNLPLNNAFNLLTLVSKSDGPLSIKPGTLLEARVVDILDEGHALLRLLSAGSSRGMLFEASIKPDMGMSLSKGQDILLEIIGGKDGLNAKIIEDPDSRTDGRAPVTKGLPADFMDNAGSSPGLKISKADLKLLLNLIKNTADIMKSAGSKDDIVSLVINSAKSGLVKKGDIVRAEVIDIKDNGSAVVRLKAIGTERSEVEGEIIKSARPGLFSKGESMVLEVLSGKINIKARLVELPEIQASTGQYKIPPAADVQYKIPPALYRIIDDISGQRLGAPEAKLVLNVFRAIAGGSRAALEEFKALEGPMLKTGYIEGPALKSFLDVAFLQQDVPVRAGSMSMPLSGQANVSSEIKLLMNLLKPLPVNVRAALPGLENLEKIMENVKGLTSTDLKGFIEHSGVAFESRLKTAVLNFKGTLPEAAAAFQKDGDIKGLMLRLKELLGDREVAALIARSGGKAAELSTITERLLNNLELFQTASKFNDMFYTFLPVLWDGLENAEFFFKKGGKGRSQSCSCDLNLDLKGLGKMSVSITQLNKSYYVTFRTEDQRTGDLINEKGRVLQERFSAQGLILKALNVNSGKKVVFGQTQQHGVSCKA